MLSFKTFLGIDAIPVIPDKEAQNKLSAINLFLRFGFVIALFYIGYNIVIEQYMGAVFAAIFFAVLTILFYTLFRYKKNTIIAYTIAILLFIILLLLYITGGFSGYDTLWYYVYPAVTLFLLGNTVGSIFNFVLIAITIVLAFFPQFPIYKGNYDVAFKVQFFASYISVWAISYMYEYVRKQTRQKLMKAIEDTKRSHHSNDAKTEFILELSHQIRTPLSSIFGIITLMKETKLSATQTDFIDGIYTSANNLVTVVDNIANVGEIKVDTDDDSALSFSLDVVLRKSIDEFKLQQAKSDIRYSLNISNYIPDKLIGNPNRVENIVKTLLLNIYENSKKKTTHIDVYVSDKKETSKAIELMFELHCNSLRANAEIADTEYDYSANQDSATLKAQQNSINNKEINEKFDLAAAKRIVESFGGSIGVKKKDDSITIFWFTLLLWKANAETKKLDTNAGAEFAKTKTQGVRPFLAQARVLIVEDNLMNQKVISLAIRGKVASYEVVNNGKEAIEMFGNAKFDLILMDIMMPVLDGYKAAAKIRELEIGTNIHTPIIALTANALNGDREKCLAIGMDDYVSKPFQIEYLLDKMEAALIRAH